MEKIQSLKAKAHSLTDRIRKKYRERKYRKVMLMEFVTLWVEHVNWNAKARPTMLDRFFSATFLTLLPASVTPNQLTGFRFLTIPFIAYCFLLNPALHPNFFLAGCILFVLAAFSDALDGALARTTKQITDWGIVHDPFADKLLIGSVALILIARYLSVTMASLVVLFEISLIMLHYHRHKGRAVPARISGKIKMILQCLGIISLLLYLSFGLPVFLTISFWLIVASLIFAFICLFIYHSI